MLRKHLGMSVADVDSLPWWQYQMYIEQLNEDLANQSQGQESGQGETGENWQQVNDGDLMGEGFAVRST